ncbi:MAG: hypothetical protein KGK44_11725, partial [Gammaproteobacteria bacterium]|nr:hypothetical protein [Gammaproteobacteria bacterium]
GSKANAKRFRAAARGKYIAICEGDDYWICRLKLQQQVNLFTKHQRLMLAGHPAEERDAQTGRKLGIIRPAFSSRLLSMHELILGDGGLIPSVSMMFRRELISNIPSWQANAPIGDYPLVLRAGLTGEVATDNKVMAVYRRNVPGSWSQRRGSTFDERWNHACAMRKFLSEFNHATEGTYAGEVRRMTSKYLSDALVRYSGDAVRKRTAYITVSANLTFSDRIFSAVALVIGTSPGIIKTTLRKIRSLSRILHGEWIMPHLKAG